jgi:ribosome-binding factor A
MGREGTFAGQARPDRKTLQLCRQIERALVFALSETRNELLLDAQVEGVLPAPDAGHLLVQVSTRHPKPFDVLLALQSETPRLRTAAAEAITRRKAPELAFQIVHTG